MRLKRLIRSGFNDFKRNSWLSVVTITVFILALFVIQGLILFSVVTETVVASLQDKIDISVYFKAEVLEENILAIQTELTGLPEVKAVEYISQDEALSRFKNRHSENPIILEALTELDENPLVASLNIKAKVPEQYSSIAAFLGKTQFSPLIDKVTYFQNKRVIERLGAIIRTIQRSGIVLSLTLAAIAVLITFNTIRLAIYTSREEINIMKLVGATKQHIRGPYIFEGALYGLIAAALTLIIYLPVNAFAASKLSGFLAGTDLYQYYLSNLPFLGALMVAAGVLLGTLSSFIAVRRYLKVY
jgi:cell division transport system permease protein